MFMSRITLSPLAGVRDLATVATADAYSDHRLLWRFFPDCGQERSFLYRRMEREGKPSFLVVSSERPSSPSPEWILEVKRYEPRLREGQVLAFSLRANPVVRRRTETGRQVRHDVVMDAKKRFREEHPEERIPMVRLIEEAGTAWLQERADRHGFAVDPGVVRCEGYRQHVLRRRGRTIRFSSLDMEGRLTVTDPERFLRTLHEGIGPEKAFGCGLLLVRRT